MERQSLEGDDARASDVEGGLESDERRSGHISTFGCKTIHLEQDMANQKRGSGRTSDGAAKPQNIVCLWHRTHLFGLFNGDLSKASLCFSRLRMDL
jgi:hypothetical protein